MIGFVTDLVVEEILAPQATAEVVERRAFVDPGSTPIDVEAQEIDLLPLGTTVVGVEIGGESIELRHTVDAAIDVQHTDPAEARRLRDGIVLDLVLRTLDAKGTIESAVDDETGQYVTRIAFAVDYRPLGISDTNESARITFTVDTQLDR